MKCVLEDHNTLNPKIWDRMTLLPKIKEGITRLITEFVEFSKLKFRLIDVIIVGSNAAYNYRLDPPSDIDVHLIVDYNTISSDEAIVPMLVDGLKSRFNAKYDVDYCGFPVELYVEDIQTTVVSNGIYSVLKDRWIKEPVHYEATELDITDAYNEVEIEVKDVLNSGTEDDISNLIDELYYQRKMSIAVDGEFSVGNLVFKALRAEGYIDKLKEKRDDLKSKELCVEKLNVDKITGETITEEANNDFTKFDKHIYSDMDKVVVRDSCNDAIYSGLEKYEPMNTEPWTWNDALEIYELNVEGAGIFQKEKLNK